MALSIDTRRKMLEDEIELYTADIAKRGLYIKGSLKQEILNPSLAARRACMEAIRKLELQDPPAKEANALKDFLDKDK